MKTHRSIRFAVLGGLVVISLFLLGAGPARAQNMDPRWLPWVGCWEPVDSVGTAQNEGPMICFRPVEGQSGIEMLAVQGSDITSHRMIQADGRAWQESQEGCSGTARAQFSRDGQRVFTVADLQCEGGVGRKTTGIMSLVRPNEWLDVKSLDVGGQSTPWVERYRLASPARTRAVGLEDIGRDHAMAIRSARMAAISPINAADVVEATKVVDADAVKAWVAVRGNPFVLNAKELLRLKKSGVPSSVIDVMVAVTYPNKFAFAGPNPHAEQAPRTVTGTEGYYPRARFQGCDPFFWNPFCYGYGYGYGSYGYGYNPYFGGYYSGLGYGSYYGGYTPVIINVQPNTPSSGGYYEHGRVVKGRGYTRGGSGGSSTPAATPSRSSGGTTSTPRSSGSSTGRTAHRRGGGGG
jgi:hypothetical protein